MLWLVCGITGAALTYAWIFLQITPLLILGYGTIIMVHIPIVEHVFKTYASCRAASIPRSRRGERQQHDRMHGV